MDCFRDFPSGLAEEFGAAVGAAADHRPEGHVDEDAFDVVSDHFRDLGFGEFEVFLAVRAAPPVAAVVLPAGDILHAPGRMRLGGMVMVDGGVIGDRGDAFSSEAGECFTEDIAPCQVAVHVSYLSGVITVAIMVAGIDHRGFARQPFSPGKRNAGGRSGS